MTYRAKALLGRAQGERGAFQATFEHASVGIAHVAPDGGWLRVNQRLCEIVGYTREELLKLTFQDITYPEDLQADVEQAGLLLAGEIDTYSMEKRYFKKDGQIAWINLAVSLVREPSGEPEYFISVVEDITKRKQAEEEIMRLNEELEERVRRRTSQLEGERKTLNNVMDNLAEGILIDKRGTMVFANPAARTLLGPRVEKLAEEVPDPWGDFSLPEAVARCVEERESIEAMVDTGGTFLRVRLTYLPKFAEGRGGVLVTIRDLSVGRRLEESQQRFLANAAHELRTPLTAITGVAELLLGGGEGETPEVRRRFLNHILSEARRMHRLSDTLLRLARTGSDLREPDMQVVGSSVVGAIVENLEPLAEKEGIVLLVEDHGGRLYADPEWSSRHF